MGRGGRWVGISLLPFCNYWGGMGLSQFSWALLSFCLQDGLGVGWSLEHIHSLVRKEQSMVLGKHQMEDLTL